MKRFFTRKSLRNTVAGAFVREHSAGERCLRAVLRHISAIFGYLPGISSKSGSNALKHKVFGSCFGIQIPSETHGGARRLSDFSRCCTGALFGCVKTNPRWKVFFPAVLLLFVDCSCFGTPASPNNALIPPPAVGSAKKARSAGNAPGTDTRKKTAETPSAQDASNTGAAPNGSPVPSPDVASPNAPTPNAEPKEIKTLKSYCKHHPNDWEGFYNLGIEQYKLMDYNAAQQSFAQALQNCSDPKEQEKIFYNLGNAGFRFSQSQSVDQQVLGFKESLQNYENALAIDKEAKDTKHNIEVVKRYLKRAEKQQQQQPKPDDRQDDNKNLKNMEKDKSSSDNKDQDKDKDQNKDKDDKSDPKDDPNGGNDDKNVDLEQKEMDNILNRAKKVEKMLPPSSLNPQAGGKDPVIRDW